MATTIQAIRETIQLARQSVAEDDRIHPSVGALAMRGTSIVETAYRGEVVGYHAEEALLQKLRDAGASVPGMTLFTTLEPCTNRGSHIPCAQLIAEARPRKVVIGILDPNRRIQGEGVQILQEAGIQISMYPDKYALEIRELNSTFLRQHRGLRHGIVVGSNEVDRQALLNALYGLTPANLSRLITALGSEARGHVPDKGTLFERVDGLVAWAEGTGGPGIERLRETARSVIPNFNIGPSSISTGWTDHSISSSEPNPANESAPSAFTKLVSAQKRQIENTPLLRNLVARESIAFLFPDVYIDPRVRLRKRPSQSTSRFSEWIAQNFTPINSVAVMGPSGVGKTTALVRTYFDYANRFLAGESTIVPVYIELRQLRLLRAKSTIAIIKAVARQHGVRIASSDFLQHSSCVLLFLDGLDEYLATLPENEPYQNSILPLLREWHMLGTRPEAYFHILGDPGIEGVYSEVLELIEWSVETEVRPFIRAYFQKTSTRWQQEASQFESFLDDNGLTSIIGTPLALTMLIVIWRYEREPRDLALRTRADLYTRFFEDWSAVEVKGDPSGIKDGEQLIAAYKSAAWLLYHSGRQYGLSAAMSFAELCDTVGTQVGVPPSDLGRSRAFRSLLLIAESRRHSGGSRIRAFRHESLQAFLVAEVILDSLLEHRPALEDVLGTVFTYEVNTFVRERFETLESEARSIIEARLFDAYLNNLPGSTAAPLATEIRNSATYYLGRLGSPRLLELYARVRNGEISEHPMVTGTMASGLFLMNHEEGERDYLSHLRDDHPDDIRTRKYHLVYYGDLPPEGPDGYLIDTPATGHDDWRRTRGALVRRFASTQERDLRLRAYDLTVFRRLCETRNYRNLTIEEANAIRSAGVGIAVLPEYKQRLITDEITRIVGVTESARQLSFLHEDAEGEAIRSPRVTTDE